MHDTHFSNSKCEVTPSYVMSRSRFSCHFVPQKSSCELPATVHTQRCDVLLLFSRRLLLNLSAEERDVPVQLENKFVLRGLMGVFVFALQPLITPATMAQVNTLMNSQFQHNFSTLCKWGEEVQYLPRYSWSPPLHSVNTPDNLCNYNYSRKSLLLS